MKKNKKTKGFTLIEALVSILVVSFLIFVFASISFYLKTAGDIKNTILAYNIAQEEIEALRNLTFNSLINQTEGSFLNVVHNQGTWQVINDGATNVYELSGSSQTGLTGLARLPFGPLADYFLEADIKIDPDSPSSWQTGFFLRIKDINNFYRVNLSSTNLYLSKKIGGAETLLFSTNLPTTTGSWNTYKFVASGNNFEIYRNATLLGTAQDPESSLSKGNLALLGLNGVHAYFDEIKINGSYVANGNFEEGPLNEIPKDWEWLSLYELPQGEGYLTVEDYEGDPNIKNILVTVRWQGANKQKEIKLQTLISKYGIHN